MYTFPLFGGNNSTSGIVMQTCQNLSNTRRAFDFHFLLKGNLIWQIFITASIGPIGRDVAFARYLADFPDFLADFLTRFHPIGPLIK